MTVDDSKRAELTAAMMARHGSDRPGGTSPIAGGGGGPHPPGMDARVAALEADMKDVKASQQRVEVTLARMEETLKSVATKAEVTPLSEKINGLDARLVKVEKALDDTIKTAVGKAIGPVQLPAIIVSTVAALGLLAVGYGWISHQPWFPR